MKLKNILSKIKTKLFVLVVKNKKLFTFFAVLIAALLIYFSFLPSSTGSVENKTQSKQTDNVCNENYAAIIETKIENMLLSLSEVTKADVMVICDSTEVYEYLKNTDETKAENGSSTIREEVAYEKDGSNSKPIVITIKSPKIVGVWVIINSVSASTKLAITNSLKSVLNIDESSINILKER